MTLVSTDTRYGWISTINHWLTVVLFMATLALGLLMDELCRAVFYTPGCGNGTKLPAC
jgi:cytochrome b561